MLSYNKSYHVIKHASELLRSVLFAHFPRKCLNLYERNFRFLASWGEVWYDVVYNKERRAIL